MALQNNNSSSSSKRNDFLLVAYNLILIKIAFLSTRKIFFSIDLEIPCVDFFLLLFFWNL